VALSPDLVAFATGTNFAALTTLFDDGHPQTQVMWIDADEDHLLINTEVHRQKYLNVQRDPRVTVLIWDAEDPYRYVEVRGRVVDEVRGPGGPRPHRRLLAAVLRQGLPGERVRSPPNA
jgi:PPOX class probable F420-dependent enzyme